MAAAVVLAGGITCLGQEIRAANGQVIKGQAIRSTDEGLEVQTQTGPRTYSWETLSVSTRYRHDPVFRANYAAILKGLPPSARTIEPDTEEGSEAEPEPEAEAQPREERRRATREPASLMVFDQAQYENIDPLSAAQFPAVGLRSPKLATYFGLQYGPGKGDVAYLALDTKGSDDPQDVLFVYTPQQKEYEEPLRITGFKRSSGDRRIVSFKKFKLNSRFGQVDAEFDVDPWGPIAQTNVLSMAIDTVLSKGDVKSQFVLVGQVENLVQGEGIINVKGILDLPVLWVSVDTTGDEPMLVGNLNMSHLKIVPKDGMDNRVAVVISDDKGDVALREAIKLDKDAAEEKYGIVTSLKKLEPDRTYILRASIDLGPFLGPAAFEDKIKLPAPR